MSPHRNDRHLRLWRLVQETMNMLMIIYSSALMTGGGARDYYRDRPAQLLLSLASGHHKAAAARHWQATQILRHGRFYCWQNVPRNFLGWSKRSSYLKKAEVSLFCM